MSAIRNAAIRDRDGLAVIGRTLNSLRGIRFGEGEGGDATAGTEQGAGGGEGSGYTPPATQEALNAIIADRLSRERSKFADYEDIKSKAARLDEIEDANRSELEKAQARAEELAAKIAEREAADAKAEEDRKAAEELAKVVAEVATAKGIAANVLRGSTREELEAHADALVQIVARKPGWVPTAGTGNEIPDTPSLSSGRERAKARSK